jgi:hypothetical protein
MGVQEEDGREDSLPLLPKPKAKNKSHLASLFSSEASEEATGTSATGQSVGLTQGHGSLMDNNSAGNSQMVGAPTCYIPRS